MESLIKKNPDIARLFLLLAIFGILYMVGLHQPVVIDYDEGFLCRDIPRDVHAERISRSFLKR